MKRPLAVVHLRDTLAVSAVAIILSVVVLAACGSEPGDQMPSGVGGPFATRAGTVCQTAFVDKQAWSAFPAAGFDPNQPDPAAFPEVAVWLEGEVAPTFEAWLDGLTALGNPPTGQQAWADVLSAIDTIVHLNADQIVAAKGADTQGFVEATVGLHAVQSELERASAAAGVPTCADVHK